MGKPISEYEARHLIFQPKNAFSGMDYVPKEFEEKHTDSGLFGESDDEEQAAEEAGPPSDRVRRLFFMLNVNSCQNGQLFEFLCFRQ